jgi:hypothetical protein
LYERASAESRFSFTPLDPLLGKTFGCEKRPFGCEKRIWSMKNDDSAVKSEHLAVKNGGTVFRFS